MIFMNMNNAFVFASHRKQGLDIYVCVCVKYNTRRSCIHMHAHAISTSWTVVSPPKEVIVVWA